MLDDATIVGADQIKADMRKLAERAQDLHPVWDAFKPYWDVRQKQAFTVGPMAGLRASTIKRKPLNKSVPLVRTGKLRLATYKDSPVKETDLESVWGIRKGLPIRKLAILHKSMRRYDARVAVPPELESDEQATYRKLLREHLLKAWDES